MYVSYIVISCPCLSPGEKNVEFAVARMREAQKIPRFNIYSLCLTLIANLNHLYSLKVIYAFLVGDFLVNGILKCSTNGSSEQNLFNTTLQIGKISNSMYTCFLSYGMVCLMMLGKKARVTGRVGEREF